jgi:transcriptional regulator with GAF, ATPase, and Fis domain
VTLRDAGRAHIRKTLNEVDGVIAAVAQRLSLPRSTLFYKMGRLGIGVARHAKAPKAGARPGQMKARGF